jgi:pimeloyl-ACP methyl ester carboxylesterase
MTETIETADLVIAYERWGPDGGQPVVLVHGWPDDVHCWDGVVDMLTSAGYRVYAPYLRGFGPTRFRDQATMRSGQIGALGCDLRDLIVGLDLRGVLLAGHDWGARASYVACVLVPERISGLVAMSVGYGSASLDAPISFQQARAYWYQWFFATPKGRATLERDRRSLCRRLWETWAPSWSFTQEAFDEAASAWDNPDWHAVTVHSYTHRWGGTSGDPAYDEVEARLAENPPIQVPTIVLHGAEDGATLVAASEDKDHFFTATYERRVLEGVGHFVPREAPSQAAEAILRLTTWPGERPDH